MKTIKPREVLYFDCMPVPTQEGDAFIWFALDQASQFCFQLGVSSVLNDQMILDKIKGLLIDENFNRYSCPFELVMYRTPHLEEQINTILKPAKGFVSFNEERFYHATHEFITAMFEGIR